ncbi:RbsD/FucU domain-containing protein [Streptomyces sp. M10(2022)]
MKKSGILNRHLAGALAELGHGDEVLICDVGMPIPAGPGSSTWPSGQASRRSTRCSTGCWTSWSSRAGPRRTRYRRPTGTPRACWPSGCPASSSYRTKSSRCSPPVPGWWYGRGGQAVCQRTAAVRVFF